MKRDRRVRTLIGLTIFLSLMTFTPVSAECTLSYGVHDYGIVKRLEVYDGKLYAGMAGTSNAVYVYDGTSWNISYYYNGTEYMSISDFAIYNGKLYAFAAGLGIYVYDGTSWNKIHDFVGGVDAGKVSLAVYNGKLYASTGGLGIYVYDGTSWNKIHDFVGYNVPLVVYNGKLYAGGLNCPNGTCSGDATVIYVYDGTVWNAIYNLPTIAFAIYNNKLYASGMCRLYVYDGVSWTQSYGISACVSAFGVYNNKLYTNTQFVYDGTSWIDTKNNSLVNTNSFAVYNEKLYYDGKLYAGSSAIYACAGDFMPIPTPIPTQTPNPASWKLSYDGPEQDITALQVYNGKLYAGARDYGSIYVYDGNSWSLSYAGQSGLVSEFVTYNCKLYAGIGQKLYVYDGSSWTMVNGTPLISSMWSVNSIYPVAHFAVYNNKLYAPSASNPSNIYEYDGVSWSMAPDVSFHYNPQSVIVYNGKLYAGSYDGIVYAYDGTSLNVSYDSRDDVVEYLAVYDGKLYAGTSRYGNIYVYDGTSWSLSYGPTGDITSFAVYDGKLYAGTSYGILVYNGTWTEDKQVSCGNDGRLTTLATYNGKLYAGKYGGIICELGSSSVQTPVPTPCVVSTPGLTPAVTPTTAATPLQTMTTEPTGIPCPLIAVIAVNPEGNDCREFMNVCLVPKNWTVVNSCPVTSTPTSIPQPQCDDGCPRQINLTASLMASSCMPFGTRLALNNRQVYCDTAKKTLEPQKNDGSQCQNGYECLSNYCSNGACGNLQKELAGTRSLLEQILAFLRAFFGKFFSAKQ